MPSARGEHLRQPRVLTETESDRGWLFLVELPAPEPAPATQREVTLSWADYEHWSRGMHSPSRVAETVLRALLADNPDRPLPPKFDCSTARRWLRDLDHRVRESL